MPKLGKKVRKAMKTMDRENRAFSRHITRNIIPKSGLATRDALKGIALELMGLVIKAWPVDTGRSRAAWNVSMAELGGRVDNRSRIKRHDPSAIPDGTKRGRIAIRLKGKKPAIIMSNAVDYSVFLEAGSSGQAPQGVINQAFRFVRGKPVFREFEAKWRGIR